MLSLPCRRGVGLTGAGSPASEAGSAWKCLSGARTHEVPGKCHHSSLAVWTVCELDPSAHAPRAHTPPLLRQALGLLRSPPPPVPFPPSPALLPGWGLQKPLLSEGSEACRSF